MSEWLWGRRGGARERDAHNILVRVHVDTKAVPELEKEPVSETRPPVGHHQETRLTLLSFVRHERCSPCIRSRIGAYVQ